MIVADPDDIVVGRPLSRRLLQDCSRGFLVTCTEHDCDWQGFFPSADFGHEAIETHYDRERSRSVSHRGIETWTIVELIDRATAYTVDPSSPGLSVQEQRLKQSDGSIREFEFPRTTGNVAEIVERGDRIGIPPDREKLVYLVNETRSHGLPTWTVIYVDPGTDLATASRQDFYWLNELVVQCGKVYYSYGEDPLANPAFEVVGRAEHQATLDEIAGGAES